MSKTAGVEGFRRLGGNFGIERRIAVRQEQTETLFEVMHLGALGVSCDARAVRPALATGKTQTAAL